MGLSPLMLLVCELLYPWVWVLC